MARRTENWNNANEIVSYSERINDNCSNKAIITITAIRAIEISTAIRKKVGGLIQEAVQFSADNRLRLKDVKSNLRLNKKNADYKNKANRIANL